MQAFTQGNDNILLPIAKVTFRLDACVYRYNGNILERIPNKYLKRNQMYDVVYREGDIYTLSNGDIIKSESNNPFILTYGKLHILDDQIKVYSPNGVYRRTVSKGQSFNVYGIHHVAKANVTLYKINAKEYIRCKEGQVKYVMGTYRPLKERTIIHKGKTLKLSPRNTYEYHDMEGSTIYLRFNDELSLWVDVDYSFSERENQSPLGVG